MSNHQKRLSAPNAWPVERKTETFTVKADAGPHGEAGVPLLVVLRDVLGYVDSRKEARYALNQDNVVINGDPVNDEERPVGMFDILAFDERVEFYRVFPGEGGRLALTPIDEDAAQSKLGKVVSKRHVPGGDVQLTLHDGETLLVDDDTDYDADDSLVVANDDGSVVAHFEYEEGALVTAVEGSHSGEIGRIEETVVTPGSAPNSVIASQDDVPGVSGEGFETVAEYVVVIDENFIEGADEDGEVADTADAGDEAEAVDEEPAADSEAAAADSEAADEGGDDE